jgi:dienelactone hydrolase
MDGRAMNRREFLEMPGLALAAAPMVAGQRPLPKSEFDYVDWSWERWREMTGEARPSVTSDQTGRAELIDLADRQAPLTESAWQERRATFRRILDVFVGASPSGRTALKPQVVDEMHVGDVIRRTVSYEVEPGERISAYLLVPAARRGRAAAVLCPHQTTQAGKKEPAGLAGNPELHTALRLAERGYVTLSYDALCFGGRHDAASGHYGDAIPFYRRRREWSLLGKMIWDLSRGIDYLEALDFIDPQRIGSIGHSHGGITTLWAMALDDRLRVGVSNCGYDTFRIDGNTFRWSHATALLPRLGFYVGSRYITIDRYRAVPDSEVIQVPFDQHMMLALIAPRPLLLSTSDEDFVFPNSGWSVRRSLARLQPIYEALGAAGHLDAYFFSGGHTFPGHASVRAYEWLDRWLKPADK